MHGAYYITSGSHSDAPRVHACTESSTSQLVRRQRLRRIKLCMRSTPIASTIIIESRPQLRIEGIPSANQMANLVALYGGRAGFVVSSVLRNYSLEDGAFPLPVPTSKTDMVDRKASTSVLAADDAAKQTTREKEVAGGGAGPTFGSSCLLF